MTLAQVTADILAAELSLPVPVQLSPPMDYRIEPVPCPADICPDCGDKLAAHETRCPVCALELRSEEDTMLRVAADLLRDGTWTL